MTDGGQPDGQEPPIRQAASGGDGSLVRRGRRSRWRLFLPTVPDVIGLLVAQGEHSVAGMDAFARWSTSGGRDDAESVRTAQHEAYDARRYLLTELQAALSSPIGQEDLYVLSERVDRVLTQARNVVREAEVLGWTPDGCAATMGNRLAEGMRALVEGFGLLVKDAEAAGRRADEATGAVHHVEGDYRRAMGQLLQREDLRAVLATQDLYRRYLQVAEATIGVADRLWYAVLRSA
ncbi:MAG: hypothetical protein M0Z93_02505 [Actinomycetota bacterium]|nr:hypothetical protein [Actinomycetota bacterium]MDA8343610.1 hypothetical protein [Actinomycetota bacterium]